MEEKKQETVTKKDVIVELANQKGVSPQEVRGIVQGFLDLLTRVLSEGKRIEFRGFGVFEIVHRKQKIGRNPKKAEIPVVIPARKGVKFTPGKKLKELIEE